MSIMIGYCGLVCTNCSCYTATQNQDIDALKELAVKFKQDYDIEISWEQCQCTGCKSEGVQIGYCGICDIRSCARNLGVETCAHCDQYGCDMITAFLEKSSEAKSTLENIHISQ
jgi:hypothetical protein